MTSSNSQTDEKSDWWKLHEETQSWCWWPMADGYRLNFSLNFRLKRINFWSYFPLKPSQVSLKESRQAYKNDVNSRIYFLTKDADLESIYATKHKRSLLNSFLLSFSFLYIMILRPSMEQATIRQAPWSVLQSGVRPTCQPSYCYSDIHHTPTITMIKHCVLSADWIKPKLS